MQQFITSYSFKLIIHYHILYHPHCRTTLSSHSLQEEKRWMSENPLMEQTSVCMLSLCISDSATWKRQLWKKH